MQSLDLPLPRSRTLSGLAISSRAAPWMVARGLTEDGHASTKLRSRRRRPHPHPLPAWLPAIVLAAGLVVPPSAGRAAVLCESPSGNLRATLQTGADGQLTWTLDRAGARCIDSSPLGLVVENRDLAVDAALGEPLRGEVREVYPWRGIKAWATNHCRVYLVPVRHAPSGLDWQIEVRAFDDGVAWRYRVPGTETRRVRGEATSWTFPAQARVWFQTNTGDYEGPYQSSPAESLPTERPSDQGPRPVHFGPPVAAELDGGGYLWITEADLKGYSGMTLRPVGDRRVQAAFEDDPQGFRIEGEIVTPWRVTVAVPDLQALVNTDILANLCEPPNPRLFPDGARTAWIKPGRALVTWCVFGNDGAQWHLQKWFVDQCAAMHCEYLLVDAGWRTERWGWLAGGADVWARMKELAEYASARGVGLIMWHAYPEGRDDGPGLTRPEARRELLDRCREAGVRGVKIDFFNSERLEVIRVYEELARLAAERQLSINFHGANKPTGEVRTWPNEVTREGLREQEYLLWDQLPLEHYAALPFTRFVAGHGDFLPTYVRSKFLKNTTATFQMATALLSHSSFVCWPDHPDEYRVSPFLGLIQDMPVVWDETRVLAGSAIGRVAALARRAGRTWYVGVVNATDQPLTWSSPLSFLGQGEYAATVYRDGPPHPTGTAIETGRTVNATDALQGQLVPGGGWVAWLRPAPSR